MADLNSPSDFNVKFLAWFKDWETDLWTICMYASRSAESVAEEFPEILDLTRRKARTRLRKPDAELTAKLFFGEWFRLQNLRGAPSGGNAPDASTADKALVAAVFKTHWSFEKTAKVFGVPPSAVRYRCFQTLVRTFPGSESELQPLGGDCVRSDLYVLDHDLKIEWRDPLKTFGAKEFTAHRSGCSRCRTFDARLEDALRNVRQVKTPVVPQRAADALAESPNLTSRWLLLTWISTWPWYFRIPLQLVVVASVVFTVVTIPYLGDLFPALRSRFKTSVQRTVHEMEAALPVHSAEPVPAPVVAAAVAAASPTPLPSPAAKVATVSAAPTPIAVMAPAPTAAPAPRSAKDFFQWGAFTDQLEQNNEKILTLLVKYKAERAGDLDFGAMYLGGLYYHFNVPDADYDQLVGELEALSLQKFSRSQSKGIKDHPPGKTRVVFLLKGS